MLKFSPEKEQSTDKWAGLTMLVCGIFTASAGGFVLILWVLGSFNHVSPGQKLIPMADETALLFLLFGSAFVFYRKGFKSKVLHYSINSVGAIILIGSLLILGDIGTGNTFNLRNFLGMQYVMVERIQAGTMSFLSAICFVLISASLLMLQRNSKQISVIYSSLTLFIGYVVIVGYAYSVPVLYGGSTIPMALLTALLFVISSIGLLIAAGKEAYPTKYFSGSAVRARLLRILIPAIFILSQLQGFLLSLYSGDFGSSFGLINGISTIFVLLISGIVIFSISRSIGTSIDKNLAALKKAEEKISESEENFRKIFENNSAAIAVIEQDTTLAMVNDQYCKMTGFRKEEVIGKSWTKQISTQDQERLREYNQQLLAGPIAGPNSLEFTFYNQNGDVRYVTVSATILWNGKILASFMDITDRKIEEQKLSHFAALVASSNAIIISKTLDGIITSWNSGAELVYGYCASEMIGQPVSKLAPTGSDNQLIQILNKIKSGISFEQFETERQRKDGQLIQVSISVSPIKRWDGEIIGASTIGHDITLRKKIEKELSIKTEQLVKLNAEKDKLFSIVAHDLRSPFSGILGLTEAMANNLPNLTQPEIQEISVVLHKSAKNLYHLLENLLEWSSMQRGFTTFDPSIFLLRPKIDECLKLSIEAAAKKEIEIAFDIPDDLQVYSDPTMFGSIIRNITNNAVKFTTKGGKVIVSAKPIEENLVEISVQDTGIGMSKHILDNLFFMDVNTARKGTEGESSTGLGLIICKDFIEKHNGKLLVESEEGRGSVFRFTIPSKLSD